jgi:hypothetical protein
VIEAKLTDSGLSQVVLCQSKQRIAFQRDGAFSRAWSLVDAALFRALKNGIFFRPARIGQADARRARRGPGEARPNLFNRTL